MRHSDSYNPHTWRDPDAEYGKVAAWRGPAFPASRSGWLALVLSAAVLLTGAGLAWETRVAPAATDAAK